KISFELSGTTRTYSKPTYAPATGASADYVMSVQAKGRTGQLIGFIVNERLMALADKEGKSLEDRLHLNPHSPDDVLSFGVTCAINFLRTLATPEPIKDWSLTSLKEKLFKIGAKVVSHGRYVIFQMAEVAIARQMFQEILRLIAELRPQPPPALA